MRPHSLRSSSATGTSTANTSAAAHSAGVREPPLRVDELERRLSTERTLDIFSMQPRVRFRIAYNFNSAVKLIST